jgi:hypothetical protein
MSRNMRAIVTAGLVAAAFIIIWPGFVRVEPETATTVSRADAAAIAAPMILPLDIMISHGKTLPVEQWRDPF